jgi:predicted ribosomally synthesized peptide with SipW-like signal peptide
MTRALRRDRIRLVLAIGLLLGVGAAITMAAWTDTVFGSGSFGTNAYNVQGSTDGGTTWAEMATSPGGTLGFPVNAATLTPGDTVYAAISLRIDPSAANYGATVSLSGATLTGGTLGTTLRYGAKTGVSAANCSTAGYAGTGTTLVAGNTTLSTGSGATSFALLQNSTPVSVCFAVTLPSSATASAQSDSATAVWQFVALSS